MERTPTLQAGERADDPGGGWVVALSEHGTLVTTQHTLRRKQITAEERPQTTAEGGS